MDLLLDTNALIWWDQGSPRLGAIARAAIEGTNGRVMVSAASIWEVALKRRSGNLRFDGDLVAMLEAYGVEPLSITVEHAQRAAALPMHHTDPFDRMLVAQAQAEGLVIVTGDGILAQYGVPVMPARASGEGAGPA